MKLKTNPIFLTLILFFSGCATQQEIQNDLNKQESEIRPGDIEYNKEYFIKPGEVQKIQFPPFYSSENPTLMCADKEVSYIVSDSWAEAFVAETYFSKMRPFQCVLKSHQHEEVVARFEVREKDFPSEKLNVDLKRVVLSKKDRERVAKEQKFLNKNYASSPEKPFFEKPFMVPLESYITSIYGARRVFNQQKQTQHLGTDFRASIGVPIPASNAGRVVVARDLFYTGWTVTIDHGMGIFTIYGHLSELKAVEGEYVPQGAIIGLAGNTGRTTGPHLHWGVKVNGHFVDGHSLVKTSQKKEQVKVTKE